MPCTRKTPAAAAPEALPATPAFDSAALDALLGGRQSAAELDELFGQMKRALMERPLAGELAPPPGLRPGRGEARRPGQPPQRRHAKGGAHRRWHVPLAIPRDRAGTFAPQRVAEHVRWLQH